MKLKRILSIICICTLLFGNVAFAADYSVLQEKTAVLLLSLSAGGDAKQIAGESAILIADYDILNALTKKGAAAASASLKTAADAALKAPDIDSVSELLSQLQKSGAILCGAEAPALFSDVSADSWYYNAVMYSVANGIFKGMSDSEFAPDMEITRGMFLTLMGRMYKTGNVKYSQKYPDVPNDAYYADAVNWAKSNGILDFITEENFSPDKPITREELVTVLRGSMRIAGKDVEYMSQMKSFPDAKSISDWAKSSVEWAMAKKVVSGFEDGTFRPQATATRAQVAQIFYNQR